MRTPANKWRQTGRRLLSALASVVGCAFLLWNGIWGLHTGSVASLGHFSNGPILRATDPFWFWLDDLASLAFGALLLLPLVSGLATRVPSTDDDAPSPDAPDSAMPLDASPPAVTPSVAREDAIRSWVCIGFLLLAAASELLCLSHQKHHPPRTLDVDLWAAAAILAFVMTFRYSMAGPPDMPPLPWEPALPPYRSPSPRLPLAVVSLLLSVLAVYDMSAHRPWDAVPALAVVVAICMASTVAVWARSRDH